MYQPYKHYYKNLQAIGKYRALPAVNFPAFNKVIDFSTNDYLALSKHPGLLEAAQGAGRKYGIGSTGSRLLSGNAAIFEDLEAQIALDKETEAALIFNSGFQANFTVLSSLLDAAVLGDKPLVFFDKLNHSSLYQAVFLSGAELIRYHHNDMNRLSHLLAHYQNDPRPKFIVSETVFGMDGDILAIQDFLRLAEKYNAFIYLDEAHATGILGRKGYGLSTEVNLEGIPHVVMGTFSKALGSCGAYIACSKIIKKYLINKSPGFIYSTSLSPMVIGAALKAWAMVKDLGIERERLHSNAQYLKTRVKELGFNIGLTNTEGAQSPIVPLILGDQETVMTTRAQLARRGILVSAIRPPTVPPGASRLRIALNAAHTREDIDCLVTELRRL